LGDERILLLSLALQVWMAEDVSELSAFLAGISPKYAGWAGRISAAGFSSPAEVAEATETELTTLGLGVGAARCIIKAARQCGKLRLVVT